MPVMLPAVPAVIPNQIGGADAAAADGRTFEKIDPAIGRVLCQVARSGKADIARAVDLARAAQPAWAETTVVKRGDILRQIALLMREHRAELADLVSRETGKSRKDALGETDAAIEMGFFVAGEGRRFYGHTTTSAVPRWRRSCKAVRSTSGPIRRGATRDCAPPRSATSTAAWPSTCTRAIRWPLCAAP